MGKRLRQLLARFRCFKSHVHTHAHTRMHTLSETHRGRMLTNRVLFTSVCHFILNGFCVFATFTI